MKKALEFIVSSIVEKEDQIEISESDENGVVTYTIKTAPEDMGKIIGKGGKIIRSIRTVMKITAMKEGKKIFVNLAEQPQ